MRPHRKSMSKMAMRLAIYDNRWTAIPLHHAHQIVLRQMRHGDAVRLRMTGGEWRGLRVGPRFAS
jgi:hypothetical protein